jgi:hypothetical protein
MEPVGQLPAAEASSLREHLSLEERYKHRNLGVKGMPQDLKKSFGVHPMTLDSSSSMNLYAIPPFASSIWSNKALSTIDCYIFKAATNYK